jgi:hypothetical protein
VTTVSKKRCVFCQASGSGVDITQEHVLPAWLRTSAKIEFGEGEEVTRVNGRRVGKPRRAKPFTRRPRIVCKKCNNGWMKELEDQARPILLPLLDGFKATLPPANQRIVAAWATKTCFALMYADRHTPTLPPTYGPVPYIGEPEYLRRVWPLSDVPVLWPPHPISEVGGFNALAGRSSRWED